jgi:hypothetical protein
LTGFAVDELAGRDMSLAAAPPTPQRVLRQYHDDRGEHGDSQRHLLLSA